MHRRHTIEIRVPASTSNLGSGFDTLALAVDLPLTVKFEIIPNGRQIHARGEGAALIQQKENNLLLHAFDRACREIGCEPSPLKIEINNRIPLKRGLGSSGAAIIAGLFGANLLFGKKLSQQQILNLACEIEGHPENASASLLGGLTVNGVENGEVKFHRFTLPSDWVAAVFIPDSEISTHDARRVLPENVPRTDAVKNVQRVAVLVSAIAKRDPSLLKFGVQDWLHQPYRKALIPGFDDFVAAAYEAGAFAAFLSGSGSTVLAICSKDRAKKITQAMAKVAAEHRLTGKAAVLKFADKGVRF
ncbi:MAG: homoserine kinase [candidate division KSB1 bacterium]|nr:homoserine kinase [candidate division KSB1 bacterium]MDZ7303198.1 homoserine kinase [candidate division KSB1 bacterium]MDZ7312190.1 homoserine kinase [candidate division KSB1 bacterium]